jgi:hypothetical protein
MDGNRERERDEGIAKEVHRSINFYHVLYYFIYTNPHKESDIVGNVFLILDVENGGSQRIGICTVLTGRKW